MKTTKAIGSEEAIEIPELERLAQTYEPQSRFWTEREIAILKKYYSRVHLNDLKKHLPGRSSHAIQHKACELEVAYR
jgi:hypothetical protein